MEVSKGNSSYREESLPAPGFGKSFLRLVFCIFLVCGTTLVYWYLYAKPLFGIDDANIYMVYMRNLVEGQGFVYNQGGERVEGFTSMLWTLIGAGSYAVSGGFGLLFILNFVLVTWVLFRIIRFLDLFSAHQSVITPPAFFLCICLCGIPGFFEWNILSLMETGLLAFLITSIFLDISTEFISEKSDKNFSARIGILLALLVITRPEGIAYSLAFLCVRAWLMHQRGININTLLTANFIPLVLIAISFLSLLIFRLSYFGYPFPNTYYAKVSADPLYNLQNGIEYFFLSFRYNLLITLFPVFLLLGILTRIPAFRKFFPVENKEQQLLLALLAFCAAFIFVPVISGGDHFKLMRFYQPGMLLYLAIPAIFLSWVIKRYQFSYYPSLGIVAIISISLLFTPKTNLFRAYPVLLGKPAPLLPIFQEFDITNAGREWGKKMNQLFENMNPMPSAGIYVAGGIAWTYKGECIDLLGLNNTRMAHANPGKKGFKNHAGFDKKTFFDLHPDLFLYAPRFLKDTSDLERIVADEEHKLTFQYRFFKGIIEDEEFADQYQQVLIQGQDLYFHVFANRTFLKKLNSGIFHVRIIE